MRYPCLIGSGAGCCLAIRPLLWAVALAGGLSVRGAVLPEHAPGEVLVKLRPVPAGRVAMPASDRAAGLIEGAVHEAELTEDGWQQLRLPRGMSVEEALARLGRMPEVEHAEPNIRYSIPRPQSGASRPPGDGRGAMPAGDPAPGLTDPLYPRLYGLDRIGAAEAWNFTKGSNTVVIAILDSGIDYTHPDLAANVWVNPGEIPGNRIDDDRNGFVDDVHGVNVVASSPDAPGNPIDRGGHGTHVAGTIGAVAENGVGVVGVNWNVKILSVRVAREVDSALTGDIVRGLDYLTQMKRRGVNIVACNHSWGGLWPSMPLGDAFARLAAAGVINVCGVGNQRTDHQRLAYYPNEYGLPGMIRVAASEWNDRLVDFTDFSRHTVEIAAPGDHIWSTLPDGGYASWSGTSMATPHVTGALGLMFSIRPDLTPEQARLLLMHSADPLPGFDRDRLLGGGRLNVGKAVRWLAEGRPLPTAPPRTPPPLTVESVSRSPEGFEGSGSSSAPSLSADGRFVAFASTSTNLVAGDTNSALDVILLDRATGRRVRVSEGAEGIGNGASTSPVVSGDGRVVVFATIARNLHPDDTNALRDLLAWDRESGAMDWVSRPEPGADPGISQAPVVSHDGRWVAFESSAALVGSDVNSSADIYLRDRETGSLTLVSIGLSGAAGSGVSTSPSISADGRFIAFVSSASDLVPEASNGQVHVYVRDRVNGTTERVSVATSGEQAAAGSARPRISGDGRFVAFQNTASNLDPVGTGAGAKIFLRDRQEKVTRLATRTPDGTPISGGVTLDGISGDGRWVLFRSSSTQLPPRGPLAVMRPFAWDRLAGDVVALLWSDAGEPLNAVPAFWNTTDQGALDAALSADGRFVAASTTAWNLVPGEGIPRGDVFVSDRGTDSLDLAVTAGRPGVEAVGAGLVGRMIQQVMSLRAEAGAEEVFTFTVINRGGGNPAPRVRVESASAGVALGWPPGTSEEADGVRRLPPLEAGGRVEIVARLRLGPDASRAAVRLVAGGSGAQAGAFGSDRATAELVGPLRVGEVERISRSWDSGMPLLRHATQPVVSDDGRRVVYSTLSDRVMRLDRNEHFDVFVVSRTNDAVEAVSGNASGPTGNDWSIGGRISGDGRFAVFSSWAANLGMDANSELDVFLKNLQTGAIETASRPRGANGNYGSTDGWISQDGRYVTYASGASTFTAGDTNRLFDVFQWDRQTGTNRVVTRLPDGSLMGGGGLVVSRTGRFVAFGSGSTHGGGTDDNRTSDAFLWDRDSGTVERLSTAPSGDAASGQSSVAALSDDGRWVVLQTDAPELGGPFQGAMRFVVLDRLSRSWTPASAWLPSPDAGWRVGDRSGSLTISPDGEWLLMGLERVVGAGESARFETRVELVHRETGRRRLVAEGARGVGAPVDGFAEVWPTANTQQSSASHFPGSSDGRFVVFAAEGREGASGVWQAYLADLGPEVSAAGLRLTRVAPEETGGLVLEWNSTPHGRYVIEHSGAPEGPFAPVGQPVMGVRTARVAVTPASDVGFFRVRLLE